MDEVAVRIIGFKGQDEDGYSIDRERAGMKMAIVS